jgi:hypothetical protein
VLRAYELYAAQLRRWFGWCERNGLDPVVGIQRAHVELYIRQLGESGPTASSVANQTAAHVASLRLSAVRGG